MRVRVGAHRLGEAHHHGECAAAVEHLGGRRRRRPRSRPPPARRRHPGRSARSPARSIVDLQLRGARAAPRPAGRPRPARGRAPSAPRAPSRSSVGGVRPKTFTATSALTPETTSSRRIAIGCVKLNVTPGIVAERVGQRVDQRLLVAAGRPLLVRVQHARRRRPGRCPSPRSPGPGRPSLVTTCGPRGSVRTICSTRVEMRDRFLQRHRRQLARLDQDGALVELRHELGAEERQRAERDADDRRPRRRCVRDPVTHRVGEVAQVALAQPHEPALLVVRAAEPQQVATRPPGRRSATAAASRTSPSTR